MARVVIIVYGVFSYLVFLASFLYAIAFVGNLGISNSIDAGRIAPFSRAIVIDLVLLSLFAIQHSLMARPGFKRWWTRSIPQAAERSTYVLISSVALLLLLTQWRPMTAPVWTVTAPAAQLALKALFWLGWLTVLLATFMIDHFDLFGLRQVYVNFAGRPYPSPEFQVKWLYRYVRHPIMTGFLVAFWATPQMTLGHLIFAVATTGYILIGTALEERDLVAIFGDAYHEYCGTVWGLLPLGIMRPAPKTGAGAARNPARGSRQRP